MTRNGLEKGKNDIPIRKSLFCSKNPRSPNTYDFFLDEEIMKLDELPTDVLHVIMELTLYRNQLPYWWNQQFNNCMRELPKVQRATTSSGKFFIRYDLLPGESFYSSRPYKKKSRRIFRTDHNVTFGSHVIKCEEICYGFV